MNTKTRLKYCCIDATPRDRDWSVGWTETWEAYEATRCDKCGEAVLQGSGETHAECDSDSKCDGYVPGSQGPMMNYFYPLPDFDGSHNSALVLADLPLCLVSLRDDGSQGEEQWGLALTGGGMDLSWEICAAYIALGYFPPVHFCDLPQMAGRGQSAKDRRIIAACRKSLQARKQRTGSTLRRLRENFKKETATT